MKKLIAAAGILALAACAQPEATDEAPAEEEAVAETVEGAGTFDYASEEGSGRIVMNEDGTFENTFDGETTTGTWTAADGQTCFTGSEEGAEEVCWTDGEADESGVFTSTSPDGTTVTVTPVAADDGGEDAMAEG
ncbi:MAG: hypothetical protein EP341_09475 [Sphingomonadales bacterium]|nr:MAG: hypothetical protein EP341_09475 [Sphingomonadales bacterium]